MTDESPQTPEVLPDVWETDIPNPGKKRGRVKHGQWRSDWLSQKQKLFCDAYISDPKHDPLTAYITAGYTPSNDSGIKARALLQQKAVRSYIEKNSHLFPEEERWEILEGQRKCVEFWKALMDGEYIHGEKITIRHRLEASVYLAKACGLQDRFATRKLETQRPAVAVNVLNSGQTAARVELVNPYALPPDEEVPDGKD